MNNTYIKLNRSLLTHRYFDNVNVLKVWLYFLMKASYKPRKYLAGAQTIDLEVGQFIFGRDKASRDLNMTVQTIRTIVKLFENDKKVTIIPTNKFSIITIIDFGSYQVSTCDSNQHINQQLTSNQPATNQQLTTNKKVKKEKNKDLYSDEFENFWKAYPKKTAKGSAFIEWQKAKPPLDEVLNALEWQRQSKKWIEGYILDPERYIKRRCWQDEPETALSQPSYSTKGMEKYRAVSEE